MFEYWVLLKMRYKFCGWISICVFLLFFSGNNITGLGTTFDNFLDLVELLISHNSVQMLPVGVFSPLSNLKILDLSYNAISVLQTDLFWGLGNLEKLNLIGNPIGELKSGCFHGLTNLPTLQLSSMQIGKYILYVVYCNCFHFNHNNAQFLMTCWRVHTLHIAYQINKPWPIAIVKSIGCFYS